MSPPVRSTARLDSLTGIRALAATVVLLHHLGPWWNGSEMLEPLEVISTQGSSGVCLFFVLSGFVLAWSHRLKDSLVAFYARRFLRVVPSYWAACLLVIPILAFENWHGAQNSWRAEAFSFTLLQSWIPDWHWYQGGNSVGWSLSTEAFFYVVFPFLYLLVSDRSPRQRLIILSTLTAAAIAVPLIAHPTDTQVEHQQGLAYFIIYTFPPVRLLEFAIGVVAGTLMRDGMRIRMPLRLALCIAVAGYLLAGAVPHYLGFVAVPLIPIILLVYSCAQADLDGDRSVLRCPLLVTLGTWSYTFYLLHQMMLRLLRELLRGSDLPYSARLAFALTTVLTSVLLAFLLHRLVEKPFARTLTPWRRAARKEGLPMSIATG